MKIKLLFAAIALTIATLGTGCGITSADLARGMDSYLDDKAADARRQRQREYEAYRRTTPVERDGSGIQGCAPGDGPQECSK